MKVDPTTLRDLEVTPSSPSGGSLMAHLDRTSTKGGKRAWKERLTRPLRSVEEIREVQDALRFIRSNRELFARLPTETEVQALARYLDSNFTAVRSLRFPALPVEATWFRFRYGQLYRSALEGRGALGIVWRRMAKLAAGMGEGPELLARTAREIESLGASAVPGGVADHVAGPAPRSWSRALATDRLVRREGRRSFQRLLELAHELDALRSMAIVTEELGFSLPDVRGDVPEREVRGMWHPFLDSPVPNDLAFSSMERVMFLTGPNMSGKTTYLKAFGITVLLAHVGMGVPAEVCRLGFVDRLVCAVHTEGNLWQGVSYFQAEARRVRAIAEWILLDEPIVVLVDELFRGTNVKDAVDATEAVIRGFSRASQAHFVISSHLIEVAREIDTLAPVILRRFGASLDGGELEFTYQVEDGVSDRRLGMEVLRTQGVLEALDRIGNGSGMPSSSTRARTP